MVAYGYILPKKNIDTRLETLKKGLNLQNIRNINAKANLDLYSPLTITSAVPTITQQTGQPQQMAPNPPPSSAQPAITTMASLGNKKTSAPFINATIPLNEILRKKQELTQTLTDTVKQVERTVQPKSFLDELKQKISGRENIALPSVEPPSNYVKKDSPFLSELKQYIKVKKEGGLTVKDQQNIQRKMSNVLDKIDTENEMQNVVIGLVNSAVVEGERNIQTKAVLYDIINNVVQNNELALMALNDINAPIVSPAQEQSLMALEDVNIPSLSDIPLTPPMEPSETPTTDTLWSRLTIDTGDYENAPNVVKEAKQYIEKFKSDIKTYDEFKKHIKQYRKRLNTGLQRKATKENWYPLPISEKENLRTTTAQEKGLKQSWEYYKNNKSSFIERLDKRLENELLPLIRSPPISPITAGIGLSGGKVKSPYYSSYSPNFGNLHLMENSLKKNQLTIYRPYSKITVASKSGISPLLKKMILDIQNTLEFDQRDYENLEGDEKRVIERIIRSQKDMKNYNIQSLIDQDDFKAKKRLEILVGQINAGNNSSLIRQEMRALLKKLFDNKAISPTKYRTSLNSIKALES